MCVCVYSFSDSIFIQKLQNIEYIIITKYYKILSIQKYYYFNYYFVITKIYKILSIVPCTIW